ncbi:MAG: hypothetical protein J5750_03780 [Clostridiales bacterium]|nr:hypothetical protein [Clostridiales bacterium]
MKRLISLILGFSMVLALAGCSKEESTTKKPKKPKETTEESETEEPDTEPTEDPETDPTDTEESTSETSSDTEPSDTTPAAPGTFTIAHTLEDLGFYSLATDRVFARPYVDGDHVTMMGVAEYCDDIYCDADGYDALNDVLDLIYGSTLDAYDTSYDNSRAKFIEDIRDGQYHMSICNICTTTIFRADSKVCSFVMYTTTSEDTSIPPVYYNLRSEDATYIRFDDVVTDRAAFCNFIESYLIASGELEEFKIDAIKDLLAAIRKGEEISFMLGFDGIFIPIESNLYFKVPVFMLSDCVNMEFFGNTPASYTLAADDTRVLEWDIDEDGTFDKIKLDMTYDEYNAIETMTLWFNNEKAAVPSQLISEIPIYYDGFYYMHTASGDFVYVEYYEEDSGTAGYCFEFNGTSFEFAFQFFGRFRGFPYNPEYFSFSTRTDIMGTSDLFFDAEIDANGHPLPGLTYYYKSFYGASKTAMTKVELTDVMVIDASRSELGTITIPAGTTLAFQVIDYDTDSIIFSTVEEDEEEEIYIELPFEVDSSVGSYQCKINGIAQTELFDGLQFAG